LKAGAGGGGGYLRGGRRLPAPVEAPQVSCIPGGGDEPCGGGTEGGFAGCCGSGIGVLGPVYWAVLSIGPVWFILGKF